MGTPTEDYFRGLGHGDLGSYPIGSPGWQGANQHQQDRIAREAQALSSATSYSPSGGGSPINIWGVIKFCLTFFVFVTILGFIIKGIEYADIKYGLTTESKLRISLLDSGFAFPIIHPNTSVFDTSLQRYVSCELDFRREHQRRCQQSAIQAGDVIKVSAYKEGKILTCISGHSVALAAWYFRPFQRGTEPKGFNSSHLKHLNDSCNLIVPDRAID